MDPSKIQTFIRGIDFPATRDDLIRRARRKGAGEKVIFALEKLERQKFDDPVQVSLAINQRNQEMKK